MVWVRVSNVNELKEKELKQFKYDRYDIIIYKNKGKYNVFENKCSHEDYPLIDGYIDDCVIECAKHGARFNTETGDVLCMPAAVPIKVFKTKIEDNALYVDLPQ